MAKSVMVDMKTNESEDISYLLTGRIWDPCLAIHYPEGVSRGYHVEDVDEVLLRELRVLKDGLMPGDGEVLVFWIETDDTRQSGLDLSEFAGRHRLNSGLVANDSIWLYPEIDGISNGKASDASRLSAISRVAFGDALSVRSITDAESLVGCVADIAVMPALLESQRIIMLARIVRNLHRAGLIRLGRGRRELLNCAEDIECGIGRYIQGRIEWASGLARAALLEAATPRGGKPKRVHARSAARRIQARAA